MTQWYYADRNRQQQGPVEASELARLFREGHADDDTLVWRDGLAQWEALAAHRVELGLVAPAPVVAPAAAAPPAELELEPLAPAAAEPAPATWAEAGAAEVAAQAQASVDPARGWTPEPVAQPPVEAASPWTPEPATPSPAATEPAAAAAGTGASGWTVEPAATATSSWTTPEATAPQSPYTAPAASVDAGAWGVQVGGEVVLAGFWKRVAAYLIDSLIVGVVGAVIGGLLGAVLGVALLSGDAGAGAAFLLQAVVQLVSLAITAAYYAGFHASRNQATLGKMAIGIKVVRTDGARISLLRAVGRYFAALLSGLILCIGYLMAAFTERKQGLHDMLCDTLVVDKWAFTEHPEWQRRELGTVTIVVLALGGLLVVGLLVMMVAMIGVLASLAS